MESREIVKGGPSSECLYADGPTYWGGEIDDCRSIFEEVRAVGISGHKEVLALPLLGRCCTRQCRVEWSDSGRQGQLEVGSYGILL